jgi:hypothetical protein
VRNVSLKVGITLKICDKTLRNWGVAVMIRIPAMSVATIAFLALTSAVGAETLDFEELTPGTSPIISQGYSVTGGYVVDIGGDISIETTYCPGEYCWEGFGEQVVKKTTGAPFALYGYDFDLYGFCAFFEDCGLYGITTWGEQITPNKVPIGTGGWLSLSEVNFRAGWFDSEGFYGDDWTFNVDDLVVGDALAAAMDFDPFSSANEARPKATYLFPVMFETTSVADGDAYNFDATTINALTLRAGRDQAAPSSWPLIKDQDNDGDNDLLIAFNMQQTGLNCVDDRIFVTGSTQSGVPFASFDTIVPIECVDQIQVDVIPYDSANRVYPDDSYQVLVALHRMSVGEGDPIDFDGGGFNHAFGPGGAPNVINPISQDVDGDGLNDKVYAFDMQASGIACGDTELQVSGERYVSLDGVSGVIPFEGSDTIQTEDCETAGCHP